MNLSFFDDKIPDSEKILGLVSFNLLPVAAHGLADALEPWLKLLVYLGQAVLLAVSITYIWKKLPKEKTKPKRKRHERKPH